MSADVQPPVPSADESPGAMLRRARQSAGISLADIAERTLIPLARLQALEEDDYLRMGGKAYVTGYTRAYARAVGVDSAPVLQKLEEALQLTRFDPKVSSVVVTAPEQRGNGLKLLAIGLALVLVLIGITYLGVRWVPQWLSYAPWGDTQSSPIVGGSQRIDEIREMVPVVEQPTFRLNAERTPLSTPAPEFAEPSQPFPETPAADPSPPVEPSAVPEQPSAVRDRLEFSFSGDCWVQVIDATGQQIVARTATSGDNLQLFGSAPFEVVLGDARMAQLSLNGVEVAFTPPRGRLLRLQVGQP